MFPSSRVRISMIILIISFVRRAVFVLLLIHLLRNSFISYLLWCRWGIAGRDTCQSRRNTKRTFSSDTSIPSIKKSTQVGPFVCFLYEAVSRLPRCGSVKTAQRVVVSRLPSPWQCQDCTARGSVKTAQPVAVSRLPSPWQCQDCPARGLQHQPLY